MPNSAMRDYVSRLHPALHLIEDWAYPDGFDHTLYGAFMKTPHDVGGEPDAPAKFEEKQEEQWEFNTFVTCEVLAWRGIWTSEERRRLGNVDVGRTQYCGLPYYGRWVLAIARVLVDKHYITLGDLIERVAEVHQRHPGSDGSLTAQPRRTGDGTAVERNRHHIDAVGKGDPQCFAGQAGDPRFAAGDPVHVRKLPTFFYTRTQEYLRGAPGTVASVSYETLVPEDEAFNREEQRPGWYYIVRFKMTDLWEGYSGLPDDTLQAEISERWLEPVA
jgi:thiocyanate hydrolase subunit beta